MDETTQTVSAEQAPAETPQQADARKLAENNARLLSELKAERAKSARLLELAGADPKTDPEKLAQARDADNRARADRSMKVEKAVIRGLLNTGRKLDEDMVEFLLTGAQSAKSITVDESGVTGVSEYLGKILGQIGTGEPVKDVTQESPRLPRVSASDGSEKFGAVKTFQGLMDMGPVAVQECHEKFPTLYERLYQSHSENLRSARGRVTSHQVSQK